MITGNDCSARARFYRFARAGAVLLVVGGSAALAEEVVVHRPSLQVVNNITGFAKPVATVKENDKLTVLSHEKGGWLKVTTPGGQTGYVKQGALKAAAFAPSRTFAANAQSSGASAALASKGLEPGAEAYAKQSGYNTDAVNQMIAVHDAITPEAFTEFEQQGHIGAAKGQ